MGLMALAARPNSASANDYECQRMTSSESDPVSEESGTCSGGAGLTSVGVGSVCTQSSDEDIYEDVEVKPFRDNNITTNSPLPPSAVGEASGKSAGSRFSSWQHRSLPMTRIAARMKARRTKTNSAETRDDSVHVGDGAAAATTRAGYDDGDDDNDGECGADVRDQEEDDEHIYDDLPEPAAAVKEKGWRSKLSNEKKKLEGKFHQMKSKYDTMKNNRFKSDKASVDSRGDSNSPSSVVSRKSSTDFQTAASSDSTPPFINSPVIADMYTMPIKKKDGNKDMRLAVKKNNFEEHHYDVPPPFEPHYDVPPPIPQLKGEIDNITNVRRPSKNILPNEDTDAPTPPRRNKKANRERNILKDDDLVKDTAVENGSLEPNNETSLKTTLSYVRPKPKPRGIQNHLNAEKSLKQSSSAAPDADGSSKTKMTLTLVNTETSKSNTDNHPSNASGHNNKPLLLTKPLPPPKPKSISSTV